MISRRFLITGFASLIAAPAVIRTPGLLMPVKAMPHEVRLLGLAPLKTEGSTVAFDPWWFSSEWYRTSPTGGLEKVSEAEMSRILGGDFRREFLSA